MKVFFFTLLLSTGLMFQVPAIAVKIEFHTFENKQQEQLYLDLIAELRCVKCQNQNLAESNAELAKDMREKAYEMVIKGKNRDDVIHYMTARYGDFVLYNPPFKSITLLLWAGPPILLFMSLFFLLRLIRNQGKNKPEQLSDSERESVRAVIASTNNKEN
jgi:cytochrome c-type biogenesis protein CcmH